ncbi:MAG TPA: GNAT family N-acetyltransferase [Thermoanaerobaculia bacterium]|nr:GNAT family N-acetyltransferase [Thermoanaerobaculia bacterium]
MALREATLDDLQSLRELFAAANDTPYDLAAVAEEKCFEPGPSGPARTLVAESGGELTGAVTFTPRGVRLIAVRRSRRRGGIGSALLEEAERTIRSGRLEVFAEAGNYFIPGVPSEGRAMLAFFMARGYEPESGLAENLEVELQSNPSIPKQWGRGISRASAVESDDIAAFITARFGALWAFEAARAMRNDPPTVFVARGRSGEIGGFAAYEAVNVGLGFFGPMGVAESLRGRGLGRRLLLASLRDLRRMGHARAVISWTANAAFYTSVCGARPSLHMIRLRRSIVRG